MFFLSLSRHILLQVNGKVETAGFMSWTSCLQCWYLPNCHLSHHLVEVTALLSIHGPVASIVIVLGGASTLDLLFLQPEGVIGVLHTVCPQDSFLWDSTLFSNAILSIMNQHFSNCPSSVPFQLLFPVSSPVFSRCLCSLTFSPGPTSFISPFQVAR